MKKAIFSILLAALVLPNYSQITYDAENITLLSHIDPQSTVGIGTDSRKYSGCWGWYQSSTGKEYAIAGSSAGTYFVDISNPSSPTVCAFVPGKTGCTWREIKTYQNYCYIVSDDAAPNKFQIVDMSTLPSTVTVVVDDNSSYFERGHTIWIDKDKMYIGSETKFGGLHNSMTVYSLATPTNPTYLRSLNDDASFISVVHDMFVLNDTVYASCGNQGLYMFKLKSDNTFEQLGSFTNYHMGSAYNHSSYITENRKYLVFTDEVPASIPFKVLDIQNFANPVIASTVNPHPLTTPHNPYVIGNRWAVVSCYQDGLTIYDINNPSAPILAGYFDTHYQGGFNTNDYSSGAYRGNWGAYPFFPSGLIVALDMQNGIYILDASATYSQPIGVKELEDEDVFFNIYPNPASKNTKEIYLKSNFGELVTIKICDVSGKQIFEKNIIANGTVNLSIPELNNGFYTISISDNTNKQTHKKLLIQ